MSEAAFGMSDPLAMPLDIRLMRAASVVLSVMAVAGLVAFAARWAVAHPVFAISRMVVEGDSSHLSPLTLQAQVGSRISGNFFTVDLAQARSVFESVPWVRRALVRREFPNRLRVRLEEHRGIALWGVDSESRMVNSMGEVFEANVGDAQIQDLPRLVGADTQSAQVLEMYRLLANALEPLDVAIDELRLSSQGAWQASFDSGAVMQLGRGTTQEVTNRLLKFLSTHQQVLASFHRSGLDRIETVDLRHSEGYAIRLRGVSTVAANGLEK